MGSEEGVFFDGDMMYNDTGMDFEENSDFLQTMRKGISTLMNVNIGKMTSLHKRILQQKMT